jgi:ABC-type multidrug transport system permease subunit
MRAPASLLLAARTIVQFPRNPILLGFSFAPVLMMFLVFGALFEGVTRLPGFPTDNYFEYLAPTAILLTTVPGIGNAAVALGAHVETGVPGAALMILLGTLLGVVTFGVLTANLALRSKDAAAVQAILPMAYLLIFLSSAYQQPEQIESPVMRAIVEVNPAEHVLRPMRELMLTGYDWPQLGLAGAVIVALGAIGIPLTVRNYRAVYR